MAARGLGALPGGVLKVRRISRDTEDSSALLRQGEELDRAAEEGRCTVAGEVEDVCVSGVVNLDDRPKLGRWMNDPLWHEWDAIMVTSLDRITRDQHHWDRFAERNGRARRVGRPPLSHSVVTIPSPSQNRSPILPPPCRPKQKIAGGLVFWDTPGVPPLWTTTS
ncbi:recombinase family protein [Streptomyces sp. NPDC004629]|uniref:recombinase family protein n=1 Tax=Streptomyces sp. NPDC004629 TaxID=3364705 RepID=UPI0036852477